MAKKKRCLVAMSGGVDSSVAAYLMKQQGYDVIAVHLKFWIDETSSEEDKYKYMQGAENKCCSIEGASDIRAVARMLDIPFYVLDCRDYFKDTIVDYFLNGFAGGETPNPCIMCNKMVKFGYMYQKMKEFDADFVATGHYARVYHDNNGYKLLRGKDQFKDQSYFLYNVSQDILSHTFFPIGEYEKPEVRKIAESFGLRIANKHDSQEICFVNGQNYRDFLQKYISDSFIPGEIVTTKGEVIGEHIGLPAYTIGQRKGIQTKSIVPLYVMQKQPDTNRLVVGTIDECAQKVFRIQDPFFISGNIPGNLSEVTVNIRYQGKPLAIE
ncbi:MAG: tRNA 2-thiouridine(34) synthase MnmA, partial [Patescibacteria group bacterium]|nr:tRNA 2-thiouridine(34) synthase MnmA [Patescibacteria group bacterium]